MLRVRLIRDTLKWTVPITVLIALAIANAATVTGPVTSAGTTVNFTDLAGSLACTQHPALTGDTTTSAGSCATTTGKVNGATYPSGPAVNTVPVVTSATGGGTVTYEAVPAAAITGTGITTVNGVSCTIGASCTITATSGVTISAKTTNYTIVSGDNGTWFSNTGAAGAVTLTLPTSPATNQTNCAVVTAAQSLQFKAPASTTINVGPTATSAAGTVTSSTQYNLVCVVSITSTQWATYTLVGTWTTA